MSVLRLDFLVAVLTTIRFLWYAWSDNKVRELATVRLPWQHWKKKALGWFDDDISAFQSCVVVVDVWQSLFEWYLLLYFEGDHGGFQQSDM